MLNNIVSEMKMCYHEDRKLNCLSLVNIELCVQHI